MVIIEFNNFRLHTTTHLELNTNNKITVPLNSVNIDATKIITITGNNNQMTMNINLPFYKDSLIFDDQQCPSNSDTFEIIDLLKTPCDRNFVVYSDSCYGVWVNKDWIRIFFRENKTELCISNLVDTTKLVNDMINYHL